MTGRSFAIDLKAFGEKANGKASLILRKVAMNLLRAVVFETPVDTGRARANWQATVGTPAIGEINFAGEPGAPGNAAASKGYAEAAGAQALSAAAVKGDVSVYLTNNLPYIEALEYGHSQQKPDGMVRKAVAMFPYLVEQATNADAGAEYFEMIDALGAT